MQIVVAFYSSNTSNYASSVVDDLAKSTSEYGNIKFLKVDVDEDIDLRVRDVLHSRWSSLYIYIYKP